MNIKNVAMQLCTCTWIEIMTGAGVTLYLVYLGSYALAAIATGIFSPLIGFHFAIDRLRPEKTGTDSGRKLMRIKPRSKD